MVMGWWSYEIPEERTVRFIFNNGEGSQEPGQAIPGYECIGEVFIKGGVIM